MKVDRMAELAVQQHVRPARDVIVIVIALFAFAFAAAPALGATVTQAPTISGDPTPGSELTASVGDWTPASATATYDWLRCTDSGIDCTPVAGSCDRRYTVRDADLGHRLRVRLTVSEPGQQPAFGISEPTDVVINKTYSIPTPDDSGRTCVEVETTGPGQGTFTSGGPTGPGTTPFADDLPRLHRPLPDRPHRRALQGQAHEAHARLRQRAPRCPHPRRPARAVAAPTAARPSPCGSSACAHCSAPTDRRRRSRSA